MVYGGEEHMPGLGALTSVSVSREAPQGPGARPRCPLAAVSCQSAETQEEHTSGARGARGVSW